MTDERDEPMLTVASLANSFLQVFSQRIQAYNQGIGLIIEIDRLNQQNPEDTMIFILFERLKEIFPEGENIITKLLKQTSTSNNKASGNNDFSPNLDIFQEQQKENITPFEIKQEIQDNREKLPLQESAKPLIQDSNKQNDQEKCNLKSQKFTQILMQQQEKRQQNQLTQEQCLLQEPLKGKENEILKKNVKIEQEQHEELKNQQESSKLASQVILIAPLNHSKKPKQLSTQQLSCQKAEGSLAYLQNFNPIKKIQDAKIIRSNEEDLKYQKHLERIIIFEEKYNIIVPEKFKNIILFFKRSQNERLPIRCALDKSDEQFIINLCKLLGNNNEVAELLGLKKQLISTIKNQGSRISSENCEAKKQTEYNIQIQKNYEQFMKFCQIKSTSKEESQKVEQQIPEKIKQEEYSRETLKFELQ